MIKAAIDVGTNSVRLLVARVVDEQIEPLYKDLATTRLGEGVHDSKILSAGAMERTAAAIGDFAAIAREYGVQHVTAGATSAVRDAVNRESFITLCRLSAGIDLTVLSGDVEAYLSFRGATYGQNSDKATLVVDIGGGSTELALGRGHRLLHSHSVNLGAVRLKDIFPSGTGSVTNLTDINNFISNLLVQVPSPAETVDLIGVGGTITSVAAMDQFLTVYAPDRIQGHILTVEAIKSHLARLAAMPLAGRRTIAGLQPDRADIIIYGIAILTAVMDKYGARVIRVSETDILEGLIYSTK